MHRGLAVTAPALTVLDAAVELGDDGAAFLDDALRRLGALRRGARGPPPLRGLAGSAAAARLLRAAAERSAVEARRALRALCAGRVCAAGRTRCSRRAPVDAAFPVAPGRRPRLRLGRAGGPRTSRPPHGGGPRSSRGLDDRPRHLARSRRTPARRARRHRRPRRARAPTRCGRAPDGGRRRSRTRAAGRSRARPARAVAPAIGRRSLDHPAPPAGQRPYRYSGPDGTAPPPGMGGSRQATLRREHFHPGRARGPVLRNPGGPPAPAQRRHRRARRPRQDHPRRRHAARLRRVRRARRASSTASWTPATWSARRASRSSPSTRRSTGTA